MKFLEYFFFIIIYFFLRRLSFKKASDLGANIFSFFGYFSKYRKIIKNNFCLISHKHFSNKFVKKNLEQTGRTFFELLLINNSKQEIKNINIEFLEKIKKNNRSCIFISSHIGNWELTRNHLVDLGFTLHTVYRHANNHHIDKFIQKLRSKKGAYFYKKGKESAKNMIKALKNKEHLGLLIDQKDSSGEVINFFNQPAKTNIGFAELALKYKTDICYVHSKRKKSNEFDFIIEPPMFFDEIYSLSAKEITQIIYNRFVEKSILDNPEQWLWSHNRWKN